MSHVSIGPLSQDNIDLLNSLFSLPVSGPGEGIAKISPTTFANVLFGGGGGGYWSQTSGNIYPTTITDSVSIGVATATSSMLEIMSTINPNLRLSYDPSNFATLDVGSTGTLTVTSTQATFAGSIRSSITATGIAFASNTTAANSNLVVYATGGASVGSTNIQLGAVDTRTRMFMRGGTTSTAVAGGNYASFLVGGQIAQIGSSGTNYIFANLAVKGLGVAAPSGTGVLTNVASLYIENSGFGGGLPTNTYALFVDDGVTRLDGRVLIGGTGMPTSSLNIGDVSAAISTTAGTSAIISSSINTFAFAAENTSASSSGGGAFIGLYSNDGAIIGIGDRLGGFLFGGAQSSSSLVNTAAVVAFAEASWVLSTSFPTYMSFETVSTGSTVRTEKMRLTADGRLGIGVNPTAKLEVRTDSIGTTQSDANGILLDNSTPATNVLVQYSPGITLAASSWNTTSSTSQDVRWTMDVRPTSAAAAGSTFNLLSSLNGGAYTNRFSISSSGATVFTSTVQSTGAFTGTYQSSTTQANSNLVVANATGSISVAAAVLQLGGGSTSLRVWGAGNVAAIPGIGASYSSWLVGQQTMQGAASGNHPVVANFAIKALSLTASGTSTAGIISTVYIEGASTPVTGMTNVFALYVAAGASRFGGTVQLMGYTVATLPTGVTGMIAYVTDAIAPTYGTVAVGGGAITVPVFYNGASWITT